MEEDLIKKMVLVEVLLHSDNKYRKGWVEPSWRVRWKNINVWDDISIK